MVVFLRVVLVWVAVAGVVLTHLHRDGRTVTLNVPGTALVPVGGFAFELPLKPPKYFEFRYVDNVHLAESGAPLNPPHSLSLVRTQGHGAYAISGEHVYVSTRDGSYPHRNGRIYSATVQVYMSREAGAAALLSVPVMCLLIQIILLIVPSLRFALQEVRGQPQASRTAP